MAFTQISFIEHLSCLIISVIHGPFLIHRGGFIGFIITHDRCSSLFSVKIAGPAWSASRLLRSIEFHATGAKVVEVCLKHYEKLRWSGAKFSRCFGGLMKKSILDYHPCGSLIISPTRNFCLTLVRKFREL